MSYAVCGLLLWALRWARPYFTAQKSSALKLHLVYVQSKLSRVRYVSSGPTLCGGASLEAFSGANTCLCAQNVVHVLLPKKIPNASLFKKNRHVLRKYCVPLICITYNSQCSKIRSLLVNFGTQIFVLVNFGTQIFALVNFGTPCLLMSMQGSWTERKFITGQNEREESIQNTTVTKSAAYASYKIKACRRFWHENGCLNG
jgi:hypothetical protein